MVMTAASLGKGILYLGGLLGLLASVPLMLGLPLAVKAQTAVQSHVQDLPPFTANLDGWRQIRLSDQVAANTFMARSWDGRAAIEIQSANSMSLLATQVTVDLAKTPYLCWWWRISGVLNTAEMQTRAGDDYAARLYLSVQLPVDQMSLGRRLQLGLARAIWGEDVPDGAVNYVWDNLQPIGYEQENAYTDLARMVVLQSGDAQAGRWVSQYRNVRADIDRLFGAQAKVVQLAVTADTDNTGESVQTGFAGLQFVDDPKRCELS
jgi:hypothetical protein